MKRNRERFPEDFCFQLTKEEFEDLRCQTGISSQWGGRRCCGWSTVSCTSLTYINLLQTLLDIV